jgi:hypothetical protein
MANSGDIRSIPMVLAPFASVLRDISGLLRNPTALFGGVLGTVILSGGIYFGLGVIQDVSAGELEDDELIMDFVPGELVRKGPKIEEKDLPEKIIVEETVAAEAVVEETFTKDEEKIEQPEEKKKKKKPKDDKKSKEKPDPNKKKNVKVDDKNRDSNTPHKDLPTVKDLPGDPFAGPNGWSDRAKKGDPWATAVIGALNGLKLPAFAAKGGAGSVKFQITICKDGKIKTTKVNATKGVDKKVFQTEVTRIKLPKPPPELVKQLKKGCKKIPYKFVWSSQGGGSGRVR